MTPNHPSALKDLPLLLATLVAIAFVVPSHGRAAETTSPVSLSRVRGIVASHFSKLPNYREGDLITHKSVARILKDLAAAGWSPKDRKKIEADAVKESETLVRVLSTKPGRRFMRKVAGYTLIYDRLDRIAGVKGGERLLRDIVKLPDGHRYAKIKTRGAVPDLLSFLPKNASGKKRSIKGYYQPTGRIYSQKDLLKRLQQSQEAARKKKTGK